jgi:hypothetical protein
MKLFSAADMAARPGLSNRMASSLLKSWTDDGWLDAANPSQAGTILLVIGNKLAAYRHIEL